MKEPEENESLKGDGVQQENKNIKDNESEKENKPEIVEWRKEALTGNFMPAVIMLEQKKINVNDIVDENNKETLLHLAGHFSYYNVIRVLIEKFHADINLKNKNGYSLLFLLVGTTDFNIINFSYLIKQEKLIIDTYDNFGLNPLVHSIITSFHYAFLYFINEDLIDKHKDNYGNPLIYFSIVNNNKFVFIYLIYNKINDINSKYFNSRKNLSDVLINNSNNSITKFIGKYLYNELDINSIASCRKNILDFEKYNIYNYELLNTIYFFKTKNYLGFLCSLFNKSKLENENESNDNNININNNNKDNKEFKFGYYYKIINLRFMFYNLILPSLSSIYKFFFLFTYFTLLYYITNEQNNELNEYPRPNYSIYNTIIFILFYNIIIFLFNTKKPRKENNKNRNRNILESEIASNLKDKIENLPDIEEICPCCAVVKKISSIHCYLCGNCIPFRVFHSNLFGCCISKKNIIFYLLYAILKINIYYICLRNALKANPTNNGLICVFFPFWYKTSLKTFALQSFIGGVIVIHLGHLISVLLCLSVKTPYKYIFEADKRVYYKCLRENQVNKYIVQVPEINDEKKIKNIFNFLFKSE